MWFATVARQTEGIAPQIVFKIVKGVNNKGRVACKYGNYLNRFYCITVQTSVVGVCICVCMGVCVFALCVCYVCGCTDTQGY